LLDRTTNIHALLANKLAYNQHIINVFRKELNDKHDISLFTKLNAYCANEYYNQYYYFFKDIITISNKVMLASNKIYINEDNKDILLTLLSNKNLQDSILLYNHKLR
jgi:hypothetical protein